MRRPSGTAAITSISDGDPAKIPDGPDGAGAGSSPKGWDTSKSTRCAPISKGRCTETESGEATRVLSPYPSWAAFFPSLPCGPVSAAGVTPGSLCGVAGSALRCMEAPGFAAAFARGRVGRISRTCRLKTGRPNRAGPAARTGETCGAAGAAAAGTAGAGESVVG